MIQVLNDVSILLVEDDDLDAEAVGRAFKKRGIDNPICRAGDGLEALQILRNEPSGASVAHPYLILLDINMPRMNGIEFLRALRGDEALKNSIVFVLTTSADTQDKVSTYDLNIAGYILKSNVGKGFLSLVTLLENYWGIVEFPPSTT